MMGTEQALSCRILERTRAGEEQCSTPEVAETGGREPSRFSKEKVEKKKHKEGCGMGAGERMSGCLRVKIRV